MLIRKIKGALQRAGQRGSAALLALGLMAGQATSQDLIIRPHSFPIRQPPGNVQGAHYLALFGNTVMVSDSAGVGSVPGFEKDAIYVTYTGRDGRYVACALTNETNSYVSWDDAKWGLRRYRRGPRIFSVFVNGRDITPPNGGQLLPVYNGETGDLSWYAEYRNRWWDFEHGHLQARIPRAVWTVCPDFPSAASLGLEINEAQTAVTYFDLIGQDRGRRILRPDLVTPDPIQYLNPATGQYEVRPNQEPTR